MPEVEFGVRWPDGRSQWVCSPSLVVQEVFTAGHPYPVGEFVALAAIEERGAGVTDGEVVVTGFRRR